MMKKRLIIFYITLFFQNASYTQERDTAVYAFLNQAEIFLQSNQPDSVIHYATKALDRCEAINDRTGTAECFHLLAKATFQNGNIPLALRFYLQTLKIKETNSSSAELSLLHFELANVYESWSVYGKAIQHYQHVLEEHGKEDLVTKKQALTGMARNHYLNKNAAESLRYHQQLQAVYESEQDQKNEVATLQDIIKIHKEQGNYKLALEENLKVLTFYESEKDTAQIIVALNNIGVLHRQLNNLDNALNNFIRSAELQVLAQPYANPTTLSNIGILYQNQKNYKQSLRYLFDAQKTIKSIKPLNIRNLAGIENLISIVYLSMNDLNNAYNFNEQALVLAKSVQDKNLEQIAYKTRADIYEQFNDYEQALSFFQKYTGIKDSLMLQQQAEREQNLLKQFSAEQTEKEISLLAIDREIEDLKYQQDLLENEKLRQEQALQQSLLTQERLEKEQTKQALQIAQQALEQEKSQQQLSLTQQQLLAEQKDRQIFLLENEQTNQALEIARKELEAEQKDKAIAESEKEQAELQLSLKEKDFELKNQRETAIKNFAIGFLVLTLIILGLLYRVSRIRSKANKILGKQKQELETALSDLQQTQAQLVQSAKMASLGQLTAGVAHEINNPINFITTSVDALKYDVQDLQTILKGVVDLNVDSSESVNRLLKMRDQLDVSFLKEEVSELISNIEIGANRTHNIVMALRTYSRDTSEKLVLADIHKGIDSSLIILNHKKGETIHIHKKYGSIPSIRCMPSRLNQVFLNILDNAIQAVEGQGDIYITTTQNDNETISIRFRDTGPGMTKDTINHAFNPFFTTKEVGAGTGLGLYVSYNIIQQHNGKIQINSVVGEGSEFVVTLPIRQENPVKP